MVRIRALIVAGLSRARRRTPLNESPATVNCPSSLSALRTTAFLVLLLGLMSATAHASNTHLEGLLERAGVSAERFWRDLGSVSCIETMSQAKLGDKGKVLSQQSAVYDYVIVSGGRPGRPAVEESRVLQKEQQKRRPLVFLVTSGFSVLSLVFHPYYQDSFEFAEDGPDSIGGRPAIKVRFSQVTGAKSLSALRMRGQLYPLAIRGEAWLDDETGAVLQIQSSLLAPKEELGLLALDSSVRYEQVTFTSTNKACWVPVEASVEAKTRRQHWLNSHLFANHKYFTVTSESSVSQ